jgi:phosphate transport system permease protein
VTNTPQFDPTAPLKATGNLRRRQIVSRIAELGATGAAVIALAVLTIVIIAVISHGASVLSWHFLTTSPPQFGGNSGGIAPAIVGTALIVAAATAIAMPVGVLMAIYLTEFAGPRGGRPIRLMLDVMNGLPSIVIAIFIFGLLVVGHHQSGFAASVALAIIMLPLIARSSQEVLLLVPDAQREAADALGVARWRSITGVILPAALGGILTGTVLAVARAAGETAPVLLLSSIAPPGEVGTNIFGGPVSNIPMYIFNASEQADPSGFARAWGASFVLLMFILISSLGARALLARSRSKVSR